MSHLEKVVERDCRRIAESHGCLLLKVNSPNRAGIPDRMFIGPGNIIWMEFKQVKGTPSPIQKRTLKLLASYGHTACLVNSVEAFTAATGLS